MLSRTAKWLMVLSIVVGVLVTWLVREQSAAGLRAEIRLAEADAASVPRLETQAAQMLKALLPAAEMHALREDHAVVARLRAELDNLRQRTTSNQRIAIAPETKGPQAIPATVWKNVGQADRSSALETVIWAARNGESALLAEVLEFSEAARQKADAIWQALDPFTQARYPTPTDLLANLVARDLDFTALRIDHGNEAGEIGDLQITVTKPDGRTLRTKLAFRREETAWKLVVPPAAVDRYAAMLRERPVLQ